MNLSDKTAENARYMVEQIASKLKMATVAAMKPEQFDERHYDDLKDLYEMVASKDRFSINEMEAIVSELGKLRKA